MVFIKKSKLCLKYSQNYMKKRIYNQSNTKQSNETCSTGYNICSQLYDDTSTRLVANLYIHVNLRVRF